MLLLRKCEELIIRFRLPLIILVNVLLTSIAFFLALGLRFDFQLSSRITWEFAGLPLCVLLLIRAAAYSSYRLNSGYWQYVSTDEADRLFKAHLVSSVIFAAALSFLSIPGFPRSLVILEFALSLLLATGARLYVRLLREHFTEALKLRNGSPKEVVVVGGGTSGHLLIKTLKSNAQFSYKPVAVFDDRRVLRGTLIGGVPVAGPISELEAFLNIHPSLVAVIVAIPSIGQAKLEEIERYCEAHDVPMKQIQSFEHIACQDALSPSTKLTIEEVLQKEVEISHEQEIGDQISGRTVLVTGAGGSIGSELARQLMSFKPKKLLLLDHSEYNLFQLGREIGSASPEVEKHFLLANIVDERAINRIFGEYSPDIIFHAAAYKHVPMLEENCYQAFLNNVVGTRCVLRAAKAYAANRFVLISTDKAVDPSSVMGASKRIAELMVSRADESALFDDSEYRARFDGSLKEPINTAAVRFGNVINSAGSVIPLFKQQILSGGPITVTHPDMERYFMSIREAVRLVMTAGTLGDRGEIYLLDMGKPIKVVKVAKKLRALYGRRDVPITFVGMRPGEKLTEKLHTEGESTRKTRFRKVFIVNSETAVPMDVFAWVQFVYEHLDHIGDEELSRIMRDFVTREDASRDLPSIVPQIHDRVA